MKLPKILRPKRSSEESGSSRSSSPLSSPSPSRKSKRAINTPSPKDPITASAASPKFPNAASAAEATSSSSPMERELERVFRRFDTNGDGQISVSELGDVLRSLGDSPTDEELVAMVAEVDADGDGLISLEEFITFNGSGSHDVELRAVFHVFDLDQNGFISAEELHRVLVSIGETSCTMEDCGRMIRGVDSNGDGHVDFEEFKVMMAR